MLSNSAKKLLERHVAMKSRNQVAVELGISATTLSLVLGDKYGASTSAVEARINSIYGNDGKVNCPMLGRITPGRCVENYQRAQKIKTAGNPATIRLYMACRKCDFRN